MCLLFLGYTSLILFGFHLCYAADTVPDFLKKPFIEYKSPHEAGSAEIVGVPQGSLSGRCTVNGNFKE